MEQPIQIDLRKLDRSTILEVIPNMSSCDYTAPCVIGSLMSEDERYYCSVQEDTSIEALIREGVVEAPEDQIDDIIELQLLFDMINVKKFFELANKYVPELGF